MELRTMNKDIDFSWSDKKYGIREFAELFYDRLPLIAKFEEIVNEENSETRRSTTQTVCFVLSIHLQPRIVTRTEDEEHYITIPTNYPFKFHTIESDGSTTGPRLVNDIVKSLSSVSRRIRIQMDQSDSLTLTENVACNIFGPLHVTGTYTEKYLLTVQLDSQEINRGSLSVTAVPLYMPLEVSLPSAATGSCSLRELEEYLRASVVSTNYEDNAEELLIFSHPPSDDEYEFVFPSKLISANDDNEEEEEEEEEHQTTVICSNLSSSSSVIEYGEGSPPILPTRGQQVRRTPPPPPLPPVPDQTLNKSVDVRADSKNLYDILTNDEENIYEEFAPHKWSPIKSAPEVHRRQNNRTFTSKGDDAAENENHYESCLEIAKLSTDTGKKKKVPTATLR